MGFKKRLLAVALMFEVTICSLAAETPRSQDDKGSLASTVNLNFQQGMRDFIINGRTGDINARQDIPAFFATLTSGHIGPNYAGDAIKFNDVTINIGNGYNSGTGKFTAPVDGIYQISYSYLQQSGKSSSVRLMKNGNMYTEVHANHQNHDQLSKTVLVQLKKGDVVWIRLHKASNHGVYGTGRYTTFAGYLISY